MVKSNAYYLVAKIVRNFLKDKLEYQIDLNLFDLNFLLIWENK